jgi:antitoxin component of MazEF toxin-antitoxin module
MTTTIKKKKLTFGNGNEVNGFLTLTNGEKTKFSISNEGELIVSGKQKEVHPYLIGLYEMLFSDD